MDAQLRVSEPMGRVKEMLAGGLLDGLEAQSQMSELLEKLYYDGLK